MRVSARIEAAIAAWAPAQTTIWRGSMGAVRSSQSRPRFGAELAQGSVYMLRADLLSGEARALLRSVARVALIARRGPIDKQLANTLLLGDAVAAARAAAAVAAQGKA